MNLINLCTLDNDNSSNYVRTKPFVVEQCKDHQSAVINGTKQIDDGSKTIDLKFQANTQDVCVQTEEGLQKGIDCTKCKIFVDFDINCGIDNGQGNDQFTEGNHDCFQFCKQNSLFRQQEDIKDDSSDEDTSDDIEDQDNDSSSSNSSDDESSFEDAF